DMACKAQIWREDVAVDWIPMALGKSGLRRVSRGDLVITIENLSRRGFLKGMAGASAFVIGVSLVSEKLLAAGADVASVNPAGPMKKAVLQPSVYLAIDTDGTVY